MDRPAEQLLAYHEATGHTFESVRSGGHFLDWENEPSRFKEYLGVRPEPLPAARPTGVPCHRAVVGSAHRDGDAAVDVEAVSHVLYHAAGVSRVLRTALGEFRFRTYASAGALYPIEAYLIAGDVEGLEAGVYHYAPREHGLTRLRKGDHRGNLGMAGGAAGAAAVVLTGIPWRTAWKYTARGFRHLYWDAGMMMANLLAAAAAQEVRRRVHLGFVDRAVDEVLGLDGRTEFALCLAALGRAEATRPTDVPSSALPAADISKRPMTDPTIEEAREAVRLADEGAVGAFRASAPSQPEAGEGESVPVRPLPEEGLSRDAFEEVVQRRGSSRRLSGEGFTAAEYAALADGALGGLPADWRSPGLRAFTAASGLEGLPPGAYEYRPSAGFRTVVEGRFRTRVGHLCLDQRLGADAAAVTFLCADLRAYLGTLGGRGYAAAQLEAGVAAGRMYLGAYAQCLGASGITFYDDEVRDFLRTDAEPMLLVVMGREGSRRDLRRCRERREGVQRA